MKIREWLIVSSKTLRQSGVTTPTLDAEILLSFVLNKDRSWLAAHDEYELPMPTLEHLKNAIQRRLLHEPIAYINGFQEFYGRRFSVDKTVLVPRPESESIIDIFKTLNINPNSIIADVGCGSGALGITAALERPGNKVYFLDIDVRVFVVAKKNAKNFNLTGHRYFKGDLLEARKEPYDVLLCNLPYVPDEYPINEAARHEPKIALFSGVDGLDHYRKLFNQLSTGAYGAPIILAESLTSQHERLTDIAKLHGYELSKTDGLVQVFIKTDSKQ